MSDLLDWAAMYDVWLPVNDATIVKVKEFDYSAFYIGLLFFGLSVASCGLFVLCVRT